MNPIVDLTGAGGVKLVSRIWLAYGEQEKDFMACTFQKEDGLWHASYRFRYYNPESENPFDGKDRKSTWSIKATTDRAKLDRAMMLMVQAMVRTGHFDKYHELHINGDAEKALDVLLAQPWCHSKWVPAPRKN